MDEKTKKSSGERKGVEERPWIVVAIPVCNERDGIIACLDALIAQIGLEFGTFGIVLFLNNCTDGTAEIVRNYISTPWPMRVIERDDPSASAGWARRIAMEAAAEWLAEGGHSNGILLTTDADSRVRPDWVARNLAAFAAGADAVAGRISLDAEDALRLPAHLHARGRLEDEYEKQLTEIDARLDPQLGNPWPCHWSKSGATIAVRWSTFKRIGGMPNLPTGEDRAFIDAVQAHDFVVRHAPDIEVITSGRLEGRASGGVADTIRLRCDAPETPCDDRLERLGRVVARALIRRHLRSLRARQRMPSSGLLRLLGIPRHKASDLATPEGTSGVLQAIEIASPRLNYRPIRPSELPRQIRQARLVLWLLRRVSPGFGTMPGPAPKCTDVVTLVKAATLTTIDIGENNAPTI